MKKHIMELLFVILLAVSCVGLSGCGGEYADMGANRAVSGNAVSGEAVSVSEGAVSGSAVSEENAPGTKFSAERHTYCTDTNLYHTTDDGIVQCWLDGTHKKTLTVTKGEDFTGWVEYVDSNFLYYTEDEIGGETILYRVPIEKDANGYDVVKMSQRENLLQDDLCEIYVDSDYCI